MKRYIIGAIFGFLLAIATTAYADDIKETAASLIGKKVEGTFPVQINGKQAEKDAIVIDGTSYLPVRSASELFGFDVDFKDNNILLKSRSNKVSEETMKDRVREVMKRGNADVTDQEVNDAYSYPGDTAEEKVGNYFKKILKDMNDVAEAEKAAKIKQQQENEAKIKAELEASEAQRKMHEEDRAAADAAREKANEEYLKNHPQQ
ncbi:hypothetical protein [Paenibacillus cymbidii]|uniref:hypothetical protein n=1 Tax=Paenibacillus cymbidii TaxID=1639034 RepID=UPI0010805177|nr:hypothetical protein [Paenibacillus cymbidii]